MDTSGNAYVTGYTGSTEATFPVSGGPDLTYNGGDSDAFVAKVSVEAPTIVSVDPASGPAIGGTEVTITGTDFLDASSVTFGGTPATTYYVDSDTQITATAPAHGGGTVQVQVTTPGGSSEDAAAMTTSTPSSTPPSAAPIASTPPSRSRQACLPGALPAGSGVVLAPGWESYQEALCGAPLAAAWGGPVLLSSKTVLYGNVSSRAAPTGARPGVLHRPYRYDGGRRGARPIFPAATVTSINGTLDNVYDMSYKVAKALGEKVGDMSAATAIVTTGTNFPDAIGVSPLACAKKWPILLTNNAQPALNAKSAQAISELGITQALKVGTYATLPPESPAWATAPGPTATTPTPTWPSGPRPMPALSFAHTGITTGDKFPDALAAGPYLAKDNGMLLAQPLERAAARCPSPP